jgi:SAM-dependent methyltransferase
MSSALVRMFGFPATLVHGDTLVVDRWRWLKPKLPPVSGAPKRLLDVGCGTGAFTIGAALRGYDSLGLSWDERNQKVAQERATICGARSAGFEVFDVRLLDQRRDLYCAFDVVLCCENIEHILDDRKLMIDMSRCLKPGGTLLLTTPNFYYKPIDRYDNGPFLPVEDGGHVRRGYTPIDLSELCAAAGLRVAAVDYCSGFLSQKITALLRASGRVHYSIGWVLTLPFRVLPPILDSIVSPRLRWPGYSITLIAEKMQR